MCYIIVTRNTEDTRLTLSHLPDTQLVGSQETFICWLWKDPAPADLADVQALPGYFGLVQIA